MYGQCCREYGGTTRDARSTLRLFLALCLNTPSSRSIKQYIKRSQPWSSFFAPSALWSFYTGHRFLKKRKQPYHARVSAGDHVCRCPTAKHGDITGRSLWTAEINRGKQGKKCKTATQSEHPVYVQRNSDFSVNLLAPELFFLVLAHPVYKMWIIQEPNTLQLWNKLHFEEKKTEIIYHV